MSEFITDMFRYDFRRENIKRVGHTVFYYLNLWGIFKAPFIIALSLLIHDFPSAAICDFRAVKREDKIVKFGE